MRTTFDSDSVNVIESDLTNAQERRCKEVGTGAQESGKDVRCWKKRGAAGLCGGGLPTCGKCQTARHHAKTYEYVEGTVEGGTKTGGHVYGVENIVTGRSRNLHTYSVDAAACRYIAQRHRGAEGGIQ